ncbi:MAG TPA: 30S ribosomal protein S6 [Anaerolineaceae bacterium]|nr:30S ribosomal protein S6 [Chloroflexota bacterium]HNY83977.1 30S ribosomal protein S6 [Anaerolineaceae bacterium]
MHNYELVYILQADLDEATLAATVDSIETLIKNSKGEIVKVDRWGKRHLAYPIRKMNEGYYVFISLQLNPNEVANIKRSLGYNEQVLRYLVVRVD